MFFESNRDQSMFFGIGDNYCTPHIHHSPEILYVLKGKKTAFLDGKKYDMSEGDILVCPPYLVHYWHLQDDSEEQIAATVLPRYCTEFDSFCKNHSSSSPVVHDDDGTFRQLLMALRDATKNETLMKGICNCVLGLYIEKAKFVSAKRSHERPLVVQIAEYIENNYMQNITLESISKFFGYSPNYFSALFKQNFYTGVTQYINFIRIEKSLPLLKKQKISTIYYSCGFANPQQYFLNFKKYLGCTPREYLTNSTQKDNVEFVTLTRPSTSE